MRGSRTIATTSTLVVLLCLAAGFAAFGGREAALRKERLIRSCEGKILPTIAARELQVSGHKKDLRLLHLVGQLYSPFRKKGERFGIEIDKLRPKHGLFARFLAGIQAAC